MNNITNTIEIEYEGFTVEVNYSWRKGHAGNWFHPPEEDTIEINKIETLSLINEEIRISKIFLEKTLDQEINHFSIPYGTKKNFSEKTLETLSNFNFKTIVTTEQGNFDKKHLYRIPRIGVGNHDLGNRLYSKAIGLDSLINKILSR